MRFINRVETKYETLYVTLVFLMLLSPFISRIRFPLAPLLFLLVILSALRVLNLKRIKFCVFFCLALTGFLFEFIPADLLLPDFAKGTVCFKAVSFIAYSFFLAGAIYFLLLKIFSEKEVTADTIRGGIAVYLLVGIFWALLYGMLLLFNPQSFSLKPPVEFIELVYFSFTTLTTLGYGDISPITGVARNLAVMEALFGQLYIAILVARIVGLSLMRQSPDDE